MNRKQKIVIVLYCLTLAYLFSYLHMVISFPCGCVFRYEGWFWEEKPHVSDFDYNESGEIAWSIDWRYLMPKLTVATIIALSLFLIWFEDAKRRERISDFLNSLTILSLTVTLGLIATIMIYAKIKGYLPEGQWGEWPYEHGPWRYTYFSYDLIVYRLGFWLAYAFISLSFTFYSSIMSWILKPGKLKGAVCALCLFALVLSFKYLYWLID